MSGKYFVRGLTLVTLLGVTMAAPAVAIAETPQTAAQKSADDTLKDRIAFRLDTNNVVRKYDIKVKVENGVATLSGDVATAVQKAEAARVAKIDGVTRVDNQITVDPNEDKTVAERIKNGMSKTGEKIDDAWITTKINWFFVGEDTLKDSHINVDTVKNVVTLKGTVTNAAGKARAEALARQTDGVKRVINNLTIGK